MAEKRKVFNQTPAQKAAAENAAAEALAAVSDTVASTISSSEKTKTELEATLQETFATTPRVVQTQVDAKKRAANLGGGTFFDQLKNLLNIQDQATTQALNAAAERSLTTPTEQLDLATEAAKQTTYSKVAYVDRLSTTADPEPEKSVALLRSATKDKTATAHLVRYADDDDFESDSPVFLIDAVIWIQGVEVSQFVKGQVTISLNGTDGNNTASFTLDNSSDRFVWTERNLMKFYGESAQNANAAFISDLFANTTALKDALGTAQASLEREDFSNVPVSVNANGTTVVDPVFLERFAFTYDEDVKRQVYAYKADPVRNPKIRNPKNTLCFARFDLVPNKCIFTRMDPVRIFSLYPFRVPGKQYEKDSRYELWCPEFTGYIDNVAIEDDDVRGVSNITIDCHDVREGILGKMRVSTDLSTSLAQPIEALGFRTGMVSTATGITSPQNATVKAYQEQFSSNTDGFYDIKNTLFYDDVVQTPYAGAINPNQPMEEAVYDMLVAKEPITAERNNRGVRGVTLGGHFYYDSTQTEVSKARRFLADWHKFCLFGPKRRPWTRDEMEEVGRGTTTDGDYAPNKIRLWFMLPKEGTGPKNLADLSSVSMPSVHQANWNSRLEIIRNFVSVLDYNFMVAPHGDLVVELPFVDFRPEDFDEFKASFRINKGLISTSIGDEQTAPPAALSVQIGFGNGAAPPNEIVEGQLSTVFVYSPYIAARYGMDIVNDSIPFLLLPDKAVAQQRAVVMYQKLLARSHVMSAQFSYRPFLLPNRPLHHIRRSRIGNIITVDKTLSLGSQPKGEVSCGLDHVRLFTGYYRSADDFQKLNDLQKADLQQSNINPGDVSQLKGIDVTESPDPVELQVFATIAAGESTPSSARTGWGTDAIIAPASGIYVLDLSKARREAVDSASVETAHSDAKNLGDTQTPAVADEPVNKDKFRANPLAGELFVTSPFGPRTLNGKPNNHEGVDFRAAQGTPIFAVEDGTVRYSGIEKGKAGYVVKIATVNNYTVRYHHCDVSSAGVVAVGQTVKAGQKIGYSGGTKGADGSGSSQGPHLHFTARKGGGNLIDPVPLLPGPVSGKASQKTPVASAPESAVPTKPEDLALGGMVVPPLLGSRSS